MVPAPALAVDTATRSAARDLGYQGVEAYQGGDYVAAMDRLERAYAALKVPSLALWSARALEKNGKLIEAAERYLEATRLTPDAAWGEDVQRQAQEQAATEREALLPRIPHLVVVVQGTDAEKVEVTIGGTSVARALYEVGHPTNPGSVQVAATDGARRVEATVALQEGARQTVSLDFSQSSGPEESVVVRQSPTAGPEDASAPGAWQRTAGWIGIGVGAAGLIVGSIAGVVAIGQNSDLATACPGGTCPGSEADALSSYQTTRTAAGVGLIAGGILTAAGVTLVLTAPKRDSAFVTPYVGFASVGVRGAF